MRLLGVLLGPGLIAALLPSCAGGNAASGLAKAPEFQPKDQTKCGVEKSQERPLIVEWPSSDRLELETKTRQGIAVVHYVGCEMRVLERCSVGAKYGYLGGTRKVDKLVMKDEDDLYANLPVGAAKLEGKLERSGELTVAMNLVGRYESERASVRRDELQGDCAGATHFVYGVTVGAFDFYAGGEAHVGSSVGAGAGGVGAHSAAERETLTSDGDVEACAKSSSSDKAPPEGCGALVRIEVVPLTEAVAVVAASAPLPPAAAPSPEPRVGDDTAKLAAARASWDIENRAELARWTPAMHAAAKALADKAYPSGRAAIEAAMKGAHRLPGAADRDPFRHPAETLDFFGFKPTMTVLELGAGDGWYTDLLAPALARQGKYLATSSDPNGPANSPATFSGQRFAAHLSKAPELFGKVQTVVVDGKAPKLPMDGTVDMVVAMRELHGMKSSGTLDAWLAEIRRALKPGGIFAFEEHRASPGADPDMSAPQGYLPEKWVIDHVEAAGFKLAGRSEINANAKDTKDYPKGVWTLPPTFALKDQDHDKYAAIGESDRMTLKFVKVAGRD